MLTLYRDVHESPRCEAPPEWQNLAAFLVQDVQSSGHICQEFLDALERVAQSEGVEWSMSGNAHHVRITALGVFIENLWDEELAVTELALTDFATALLEWREFACRAEPGSDNRAK